MPLAADIRHVPHPCPKVPFWSAVEARRHARATQTRFGGGFITAYRCDACGAWHIGHEPESARPCKGCGTRIVLRPAPSLSSNGTNNWAYVWATGERHLCRRYRK